MRVALLALGLLASSTHAARADGFWNACSERENPDGPGCTSDGTTTTCQCESSRSSAASIGSGLALLGFVGYRITRKRRSR